jgi:DNA-binding winged helix-turn-helix (wHTH) protein
MGFRIGDFWVEPEADRLVRGTNALHLEPKVTEVLLVLVKHAGHVVSKEILLDKVWGSQFVAESTLSRAIAELRRALGDDAREPRYIETVPRRGYRLLPQVERSPAERPVTPPPIEAPASSDDARRIRELTLQVADLEAQIAALKSPKFKAVREAWSAFKHTLGMTRIP